MELESVFLRYIRMVLKQWKGFQAAIDEGMGGQYAKEKEIWLGEEIENFFKTNSNLEPFEVEYFISDILEAEFDTSAEDGSVEEISKKFCDVFRLFEAGHVEEVEKLFVKTKGPLNSPSATATSKPEMVNENVPSMNSAFQQMSLENSRSAIDTEPVDDGWTQVRRGKHRK